MKLGISGYLLSQTRSLEEILQIFIEYKIKDIEIWPCNIPPLKGCTELNPDTYEGRDIKLAKQILEKYGVEAVCLSMSGAFNDEASKSSEVYSKSLVYAVEAAKELGADFVNHYCYNICLTETLDLDRISGFMLPALRRAEELGITLCLENEAHDATRTPEGILKIIEFMDSPNFKTNFDPTNYYHAGVEAFPYAYELLRKHIVYVHLKNGCIYNPACGHLEENKGGIMTGRFSGDFIYYPTIQNGAVNIDGLVKRLTEDGYKGNYILEPHTIPENAKKYYSEDIEFLKGRAF